MESRTTILVVLETPTGDVQTGSPLQSWPGTVWYGYERYEGSKHGTLSLYNDPTNTRTLIVARRPWDALLLNFKFEHVGLWKACVARGGLAVATKVAFKGCNNVGVPRCEEFHAEFEFPRGGHHVDENRYGLTAESNTLFHRWDDEHSGHMYKLPDGGVSSLR